MKISLHSCYNVSTVSLVSSNAAHPEGRSLRAAPEGPPASDHQNQAGRNQRVRPPGPQHPHPATHARDTSAPAHRSAASQRAICENMTALDSQDYLLRVFGLFEIGEMNDGSSFGFLHLVCTSVIKTSMCNLVQPFPMYTKQN